MKAPVTTLLSLAVTMVGAMILVCATVKPDKVGRGAAISIFLGSVILPNIALCAIARDN